MEVETAQRGDETPKPQPFSRDALERELNAAQVDAVMHPPGPLLVVAGAGSGKTRVITYRLARLIATGADPRRVMVVTFTNKGGGEARERGGERVGLHQKGGGRAARPGGEAAGHSGARLQRHVDRPLPRAVRPPAAPLG